MEMTNNTNTVKTAVVIGKFDGVHKGHQALLDIARRSCAKDSLVPIAFTFSSAGDTSRILADTDKAQILEDNGMSAVYIQPLSEEFKNTSPEEFISFLKSNFSAAHVIVGFNFRFGKNRSGDAQTMVEICKSCGINVTVAEPVMYEGSPISSTRVRSEIIDGNVDKAYEMMGRPFCVTASVIGGKQLGRTIGFPTANLDTDDFSITPANGVYATAVKVQSETYPAITNIGVNPTVDSDGKIKAETYIIDFDGDLYGKEITVEFLERIRREKTFLNIQSLAEQLNADCEKALQIFKKHIDKQEK